MFLSKTNLSGNGVFNEIYEALLGVIFIKTYFR